MNNLKTFIGTLILSLSLPGQGLAQINLTTNDLEVIAKRVDAFVLDRMKTRHIPGVSLAIVRDGEIIYSKGYGYANLELNVPVIPQSNFLIASVTKTFTAVAVMMLWEQGKFKLDDKIDNYVHELPKHWNEITIQQLLNHTSGVPSNLEQIPPCKFNFDPDHYTKSDYLSEVACLPLNFMPGTRWEYSSATGYNLLGMLIENVTGESYWTFLKDRIFSPLSMSETGRINYDTLIKNRANGYGYKNGYFQNSVRLDHVGEFATGGIVSTVIDLAKFDAALNDEKLLKRETLDMMFTNTRLTDGTIVPSYGLGFGLTPYQGHKRVGHTGGTPGFSSSLNRFIDKKITVIVLSNVHHQDYNVLQFSNELATFYF